MGTAVGKGIGVDVGAGIGAAVGEETGTAVGEGTGTAVGAFWACAKERKNSSFVSRRCLMFRLVL